MSSLQLIGPRSVAEVLHLAAQAPGKNTYLSGGTDLIIQMREGFNPGLLIDLSQVEELNYIKEEGGSLQIGAATTFTQIAASSLVRAKARCLAQAAGQIGSVQIRNRGTIGGNIATASPAGDTLPALLVLEARLTLQGPHGQRVIPLAQFIDRAGHTCLQSGELLTAIEFPVLGEDEISAFEKVGSRTAVTIARLNLAAVCKYNRSKSLIQEARLAAGALGPAPIRLPAAEAFLAGQEANALLAAGLAVKLAQAVDEAIPGRYSQAYKRRAMRGIAADLWQNMFGPGLKG